MKKRLQLTPSRLIVLGIVLQYCSTLVHATWGDYADTSFQCPALTTCEAVCVAQSVSNCPRDLQCHNVTEQLCPSGRACVTDLSDCPTTANVEEENPCAVNPCGNTVACLRVNLFLEECTEKYDSFYQTAWDCGKDDPRLVHKGGATHSGALIGWTTPLHIFFYVWICVVTVLLLGWCAYNQRIAPVGIAIPLHDFTMGGKRRRSSYSSLEGADEPALWSQTGYKRTFIGTTIYVLVMTTLIGFHALLASLVGFYYAQQRGYGPARPYESDTEVLFAFELAWLISFVWTLVLKWPASIEALFLRRCHLAEATHIAVFAPTKHTVKQNKDTVSDSEYITRIRDLTTTFFKYMDSVFAVIFSEVNRPNVPGKYHIHEVDQDKSFTFRLRRYNFDETTETYMPGTMTIGHSIEDMLRQKGGLTSEQVLERRKVVGPNIIPMKKPSLLSVTLVEGSKIFYVYQIYIIW